MLHRIPLDIVNQDISTFLTHEFTILLRQNYHFGCDWQGQETVQILVQKASGLFIWAATACRFVREKRLLASRRLSMLLGSGDSSTEPEGKLDEIYLTVLANSVSSFTDEEKSFIYSMMRPILESLAILFSPLSTTSLSALLHIKNEDVTTALEDLHAILDIPENPSHTLRLHHPSLRDFLLDKYRCSDPNFWVDERQAHRMLTDECIRLMSNSLKQDICGQQAPGTLMAEVEDCRIEQCLCNKTSANGQRLSRGQQERLQYVR